MSNIIQFPAAAASSPTIHHGHLDALFETQFQGLHCMKQSLQDLAAGPNRLCDHCGTPLQPVYPTEFQFCNVRCYADFQVESNLDPERVRHNAHYPKPYA